MKDITMYGHIIKAACLLIILCGLKTTAKAQRDSVKKERLYGIMADVSLLAGREHANMTDQSTLQNFVKNDVLLDRNFQGYGNGYGSSATRQPGYLNFPGTWGIRLFKDISKGRRHREAFISLRFGMEELLMKSYIQKANDTLSLDHNPVSNQVSLTLRENISSYYFNITSKRIIVPFGMAVFTDNINGSGFLQVLNWHPASAFPTFIQAITA